MVDSQESKSPYSARGRVFAVDAKLLDAVDALLRLYASGQTLVGQLREDAKRIIMPLVWTEEDVRSMDQLEEPKNWDDLLEDLDNAGEYEYAQSQLNDAIESLAERLITEGR